MTYGKDTDAVLRAQMGKLRVLQELRKQGFTAVNLDESEALDILVLGPPVRRLQVKTVTLSAQKSGGAQHACYAFSLQGNADFIICWASETKDFYVLPGSELKKGVNRIYPGSARAQKYLNNWEVLKI